MVKEGASAMITYGPRNCIHITYSEAYIAGLGSGICIYERSTFKLLHRVNGIPCIHGGVFVSWDLLFVYTGQNRFYLISASDGQIVWSPPRHKKLASCGDMRICFNAENNTISCIAEGRNSLEEHYLLIIDPFQQDCCIDIIPNCFRVICNLFQTRANETTFLSYQSTGENGLQWSIQTLDAPNCVIYRNITDRVPYFHSEQFAILGEYCSNHEKYCNNRLVCLDLKGKTEYPLAMPSQWYEKEPSVNLFTRENIPYPLPYVSCITKDEKYLLAYTSDMFFITDLQKNQVITTYSGDEEFISCGTIMDSMCLIGCKDGIKIQPFPSQGTVCVSPFGTGDGSVRQGTERNH